MNLHAKMNRFFQILLPLWLISCAGAVDKAQQVVDQAIAAHGCELLSDATVSFDFRGRTYAVSKNQNNYIYTRAWTDSTGYTVDSLLNSTELIRYTNGGLVAVSEEMKGKYANSVNSVLYFFQLPCLLNDPAVIKKYAGEISIEGQVYDQIEVRFMAQGGGEDFEDVYMYWFNKKTLRMDYLAYNYQVEGGGTRFRKAINQRSIDGYLVQDYINYKAEDKFLPLTTLPGLLEEGKLKELSKILNTDVTAN